MLWSFEATHFYFVESVYNRTTLNYGISIHFILRGWQHLWCQKYRVMAVIKFLTTTISGKIVTYFKFSFAPFPAHQEKIYRTPMALGVNSGPSRRQLADDFMTSGAARVRNIRSPNCWFSPCTILYRDRGGPIQYDIIDFRAHSNCLP